MEEEQFGASQQDVTNQKSLNEEIREYRQMLSGIGSELGRQASAHAAINRELRGLDSIAKQIQADEQDISRLNTERLESLREQSKVRLDEIKEQGEMLANQLNINLLKEGQLELDEEIIRGLLTGKDITEKQAAVLQGLVSGYAAEAEIVDSINKAIEKRLEYENEIKRITGLTSSLMKSTQGTLKQIGADALGTYLNFESAQKSMDKTADSVARAGKNFGALRVAAAGFGQLALGAGRALTSFEAILAAVVKGADNITMFEKTLGASADEAKILNERMEDIAANSETAFINSDRLRKAFTGLSKEIGLSASILEDEALVSFATLTENIGLSNQEAGKLVGLFSTLGGTTEENLNLFGEQAKQLAIQNKLQVRGVDLVEELGKMSLSVAMNLGRNPKELAKAVVQAKALGVSLDTINKIAGSLLDFESSISNELEAQLLSGDQLNLGRARQLALMGKQGELAEELGNQEAIRNAFADNNVIKQQSIAKSIGLSVDELAQMALKQEFNTMSAEKFKNIYDDNLYTQIQTRTVQESFNDLISKAQTILVRIADALSPILNLVKEIAATDIGANLLAFGGLALGIVPRVIKMAKSFGLLKASTVSATVAQEGLNAAQREGSKTSSFGASAISKINTTALLKGAAAMAIAAGGIFVFAKALQEFDKIESWENTAKGLLAFGVSLAATSGILSLFTPLAYPAAAALAAFGVAVLGVGLGLNLASKGFAIVADSLTKLASINLISVGAGLASVGTGMMAMMSGSLLGGLGAMAVLGTIATLASPLSKSASAVQLLANSFGKLGENIDSLDTQKLGGLEASAALGTIATLASPLSKSASAVQLLANSFGKLGENIDNLDTAKIGGIKDALVTNTNLPMLAAADAVSSLVTTLSAPSTDNSNSELINEVKAMRAAIEAGGSVYIDSKSAGDAAVLNTFKN